MTISNRAILDQQNWKELLPRLIRIALYLLRVKNGGSSLKKTSAGKMAEDYVMEAIMKVYQGERRWDPEKYPDLLFYIMGILRSLIGHEHQRLENRFMVFVESLAEFGSETETSEWIDMDSADDALVEDFQMFVRDEPGLEIFVSYIAEGCKPREIAERMGLEREQIYNLRKLMKRRFNEFFGQRKTKQRTNDHV